MTHIIAHYTYTHMPTYIIIHINIILYLHPESRSVVLLSIILLSIVYGTENETSLVAIRARTA